MAHIITKAITTTASPTGSAYKDDGNWNTCRGATTAESILDGTGTQRLVNTQFDVGAGNIYKIRRAFFQFDVSAIPLSAIVKSVKFILKATNGNVDNADNADLDIRSSTQPDGQALSTAHYNDLGGTEYASKSLSSIGSGFTDVEITLNSNGLAALQAKVSAGGIFKLQCRINRDVDGDAPSGGNSVNNCNLDSCQIEATYIAGGLSFILA